MRPERGASFRRRRSQLSLICTSRTGAMLVRVIPYAGALVGRVRTRSLVDVLCCSHPAPAAACASPAAARPAAALAIPLIKRRRTLAQCQAAHLAQNLQNSCRLCVRFATTFLPPVCSHQLRSARGALEGKAYRRRLLRSLRGSRRSAPARPPVFHSTPASAAPQHLPQALTAEGTESKGPLRKFVAGALTGMTSTISTCDLRRTEAHSPLSRSLAFRTCCWAEAPPSVD